MVFAAGLGKRMRPVTDTMPKPLVKIGGRSMIDHMLDRFGEIGVRRAIVNVHYLADQLERHLAERTSPKIIISDEREQLLDQGGGIKKVLPLIGEAPFFICNTDAIWLEGARSNLARLAERWDADAMDVLLLVAASATSIGVDWAGDFLMDAEGRLSRRGESEGRQGHTEKLATQHRGHSSLRDKQGRAGTCISCASYLCTRGA